MNITKISVVLLRYQIKGAKWQYEPAETEPSKTQSTLHLLFCAEFCTSIYGRKLVSGTSHPMIIADDFNAWAEDWRDWKLPTPVF